MPAALSWPTFFQPCPTIFPVGENWWEMLRPFGALYVSFTFPWCFVHFPLYFLHILLFPFTFLHFASFPFIFPSHFLRASFIFPPYFLQASFIIPAYASFFLFPFISLHNPLISFIFLHFPLFPFVSLGCDSISLGSGRTPHFPTVSQTFCQKHFPFSQLGWKNVRQVKGFLLSGSLRYH